MMGILNRVTSLFARTPTTSSPAAVGRRLYGATTKNSADIPENRRYWRRLGEESIRNLADHDHREMVVQSVKSAQSDGLCRAHVRLITSATVGAMEIDPLVKCEDKTARDRLQKLVRDFWRAPENELAWALPEFMDGLTTTGSLCLTAHTGMDQDGRGSLHTSVGYIDPETFVSPGVVTDPENARSFMCVLRSGVDASTPVAHPILRSDDTVHPFFAGRMKGDRVSIPHVAGRGGSPMDVIVGAPCWYLGINRIAPNQTVGISDIFPVLDLAGLLDELVFGSVQRSINIGAYSLHVTFPKGTTQEEINKQMDNIRADLESGEGRAVGTTDDVGIKAVLAQLQAGEWAAMDRMTRTNVLIGFGPWPQHAFSDGGNTNVGVAAEQGSPVANLLLSRQNMFRRLMLRICWYALRKYPEAVRLLDANPDVEIELPLPTIVARDTTRESNTLAVETNVLLQAMDPFGLKHEAVQREWRDGANRYGWHFKPDDFKTEDEMEEERADRMAGLPFPPVPPMVEQPPTKLNEGSGPAPDDEADDEEREAA